MKFELLSRHEIERIDQGAREILCKTGVLVPHEEMLNRLARAGAKVDRASGLVMIPPQLTEECLGLAGREFTIYGRERGRKAEFGRGRRNYNSTAGQAHWIESGGRRRFACLDDVIQATKLGEVLDQITIVGSMSDPNEIDVAYRCVEVAAAQLKTTTKPVTFWFYDRASAKYVIEVLTAVAGSRAELARYPMTYPLLEPISPLRFDTNGIDLLFETCAVPLPVCVGPMAQAGLSGPGTLAGTLCQETAEVLAGICVVQLIRPGTPVCFGGICHAFDMRTTQIIFGGPEQALMAVAGVQMGKHYGLPVYTNTGLTDSKCADAQAGLEIAATLLPAAMAGSDIFGHLGIAGADQGASLEMLLLQHECVRYVERIMRGIGVSNETLALDVIDSVGPGGTFIDQMHTAEHFREELWMPQLLDRAFWPGWEAAGRAELGDLLPVKVQELLSDYEEKPLPEDVICEVDKIVEAAEKKLGNG